MDGWIDGLLLLETSICQPKINVDFLINPVQGIFLGSSPPSTVIFTFLRGLKETRLFFLLSQIDKKRNLSSSFTLCALGWNGVGLN